MDDLSEKRPSGAASAAVNPLPPDISDGTWAHSLKPPVDPAARQLLQLQHVVYGVLHKAHVRPDLRDDIVQDIVLRFLELDRDGRRKDSPAYWVKSALNLRNKMYRPRHAVHPSFDEEHSGKWSTRGGLNQDDTAPMSRIMKDESESRTMEAVLKLRDPYLSAIVLRYVLGYDHAEICNVMGAPDSSVKTWISRGLDKLEHLLRDSGVESRPKVRARSAL